MPTTFRSDRGLLMPPDLWDWLPEGHLAHHLSDPVEGLDLLVVFRALRGRRSAGTAP